MSRPQAHHCSRSAFTLIEMLVVITVISILLAVANPIYTRLTSSQSPIVVASVIAGQLERAHSQAIARNTYVWVRLGAVAEEPNDFFIGVYESPDGSNTAANAKQAWPSIRFPDLKLSNGLTVNFSRPDVGAPNRSDTAAWVRFTPSGEAWLIPGAASEARYKLVPPAAVGALLAWTEFGLQPTRSGKLPESLKQNVASVQLSGLTGQTLEFAR